ncbi:MAG: phosphotransferase, partial [Clostridia bacterium]|nr:phosphotransferase [Clostridia bacterium]
YLVADYRKYLPKDQFMIAEKAHDIINKLMKLDTGRESYGLIHTDIHHGNFFYDGSKITIFDFDDCAYKHFISDIAIAVFYSMMSKNTFKSKEDFAEFFLYNFMEGYDAENTLDSKWMKMLPDFLKLREVILYVAICRSLDPENSDQWCLNYIKKHRKTIENDIPILNRTIT